MVYQIILTTVCRITILANKISTKIRKATLVTLMMTTMELMIVTTIVRELENPSQTDTDGDGRGDACDGTGAPVVPNTDWDSDGVLNSQDNCATIANPDQSDIDFDEVGDVCDDHDFDGVINSIDNCPDDYNPSQRNLDGDDQGDACDDDDDNDDVP